MASSAPKDKEKGKKPASKVWPYIVVPLLALMMISWMVWRLLQPGMVNTSEGMEILRTEGGRISGAERWHPAGHDAAGAALHSRVDLS